MKTKIILLFFTLLSILLISVTLLLTTKPLYLAKVERDRLMQIQKVYHKSYFRRKNIHIAQRSIEFAQHEINELLVETPILFKSHSTILDHNRSSENFGQLTKLILILNNIKDKFILKIETHTNKDGSKKENLKLSQKRADNLKNYINYKSKIIFISAIGYGEEIKKQKQHLEINLKRIK